MRALDALRTRLRGWHLAVLAALWIAAVAYGQRALLDYDFAAAPASRPPAEWPRGAAVPRTEGLPTLVLLAHPHCPCTRATLEELAILMTRLHDRVTATVMFVHPRNAPEDWERTDLWQSAARIPGVAVRSDPGGVEAARFGALASGQTLLYSPDGTLLFSGGIVPFRGHAGDNRGLSAIVDLVSTGTSAVTETSVYGCSLHDPERAPHRR